MKLKNTTTGRVFEVLAYDEPTRRNPAGRYLLDDNRWRNGLHIDKLFEEVIDVPGLGVSGSADSEGDSLGGSDGRLYSNGSDTSGEGEDSEGEVGPEGGAGDARDGADDSVLEDE